MLLYVIVLLSFVSCGRYSVVGQTSNCSILSSDEIVPFCAGVLENDTFYHQNLLPTTDFNLFDASSEDTPCFDLVRRHLCYHYYPVCNTDTGDVVPICSDNCDILNSEQSCVDLLTIVISDVEARGRVVPEMQCSVVQASNNSQVTSQCLDINNGNASTPVIVPPSYTVTCIPIPQDNTCFSQLSHTYYVPGIFDMSETIQREFRRILSPLPATDPCRGFFTSLSCVISFPACDKDTKTLLQICPNICPFIDALITTCLPLADLTTIPTLDAIFQSYNCSDPSSYFMFPDQFYNTEVCTAFIMPPNNSTTPMSDGETSTMSSSSSNYLFGLSETSFIVAIVGSGVGILLICVLVSVCIAMCIRKKRKPKFFENNTITESIEVGIPSQYHYLTDAQYINKSHADDSVTRLLKEVETQFANYLIPVSSLSRNMIIGKGEFGVVYKGHLIYDDNTTRTVAIKTVKTVDRWLSETTDFMSESTIMAYFDHPNVLSMVGLCVDVDFLSIDIVLPFMSNGDLRAFLKSQRVEQGNVSTFPENLDEAALTKLCSDIANGMEYLAEKRFVHRDLAARNCMVDENLCVKVADFGLAKDIYSSEYYRMNSHTRVPVKWMSLESLLDGFFDEKTDVWSFGVTCWEVFSLGRLPYAGIENQLMIRALKNGYRPDKPVLCPDELYNSVISLCWEEVPMNRLTFRDIVKKLDRVLLDGEAQT
ncbi:tyrosine-protein kinase Mer-like [Dysidea avara]|uniref:tyrosine-protein kinase Mer-like n=1 Tax=Dysidea avara TaxID=196820 RepID=UPI00333366A0